MKTLKLLFACFLVIGLLGVSAQADLIMVEDLPGIDTEIQDAITAASSGDTIMVMPGDYKGVVVTKALEICGTGGARIVDGVVAPYWPFNVLGMKAGFVLPAPLAGEGDASGSKISNFEIIGNPSDEKFFAGVWSNNTDDVIISHMNILELERGINIGGANGWEIIHNNIKSSLGAVWIDLAASGILLFGAYPVPEATGTNNNLVAFNTIDLTGPGESCGIYVRSYAFMNPEPLPVTNNKIVHNKIISGKIALELDDDEVGYVSGNYIGFNDFTGSNTKIDIGYWPSADILSNNIISRNLGENRAVPRDNLYDPPANDFNPQPPQ